VAGQFLASFLFGFLLGGAGLQPVTSTARRTPPRNVRAGTWGGANPRSLRLIQTAHDTVGGHILEHPSCRGFMPTAETSSINQRAAKKSLTDNARLDTNAT
jgi:hypothetical protein